MLGDDAALAERQLAGHEVDRLDAVGALVDRRDARVAEHLRRAGLLDVAHAAMDLDAERGDLDADVGGERLGDRRQELAARLIADVEGERAGIADAARRVGQRAHRHQRAA